jgi:hypothetical protein
MKIQMNEIQNSNRRSLLARLFISPSEPRLRAGWRLLIQILIQLLLTVIVSLLIFIPYRLVFSVNDISGVPFLALSEVVELITIAASIFLARRLLDKRSFVSLGLTLSRATAVDLIAGVGITFVMMGFIFMMMWLLGWLTISTFAWKLEPVQNVLRQVLLYLVIFLVVGWNEELMSRGYHLQTIASGLNLFWGLVLSSVIFGALHLGNPNATWVSAAGIFFAGLFLGYAYLRTGQLWLPIGLHLGWNFFEGVIFGFPVSGLDIYRVIHIKVLGPELWTGGAFGPEAGLIVLPALAVGAVLINLYTRARSVT